MTTDAQETALARIREVDRADEEQIVKHLGGEEVTDYVYSFTDAAGRKQEGLSWAGTRELAQLRGNLMIETPEVSEHDDHWRVMVRIVDLDRNVAVWGGTHQPKQARRRDGAFYADDYAFEKALSKAQRNAIKNLMPMAVVRSVIAQLKGGPPKAALPIPDGRPPEMHAPYDLINAALKRWPGSLKTAGDVCRALNVKLPEAIGQDIGLDGAWAQLEQAIG